MGKHKRSKINYYLSCCCGGALSCGLTHTLILPIDIAKCRMQTHPNKYKGLVSSLRLIMCDQGLKGLKMGLIPTFLGYSVQGALKYGLYEYFKDLYSEKRS